ncbi:hypothetical protein MTBPR1_100013 [Candidatus Terasakiella magnetica]|uniref:Uncharacterized protein n=1 Tax=Candidatus Terasakiella magnetica TaxID=1867952 RepID=A0A1C3RDQ5_9PROT|nr:hypothetical protein [Candidatus Terasakiella magnetica]SCA55372.1 hypothetical protein MTBPR1_100013 [Candidatus Terasakiella magnetica]
MSLSQDANKLLNAMAEDDQLPGGAFRDVEGICEEFRVSFETQDELAKWIEELAQAGAVILEDHELHVSPTPPFMASITLHGLDMAGYLSR